MVRCRLERARNDCSRLSPPRGEMFWQTALHPITFVPTHGGVGLIIYAQKYADQSLLKKFFIVSNMG